MSQCVVCQKNACPRSSFICDLCLSNWSMELICIRCQKSIENDYIICNSCFRYYHKDCWKGICKCAVHNNSMSQNR